MEVRQREFVALFLCLETPVENLPENLVAEAPYDRQDGRGRNGDVDKQVLDRGVHARQFSNLPRKRPLRPSIRAEICALSLGSARGPHADFSSNLLLS